MSKYKMLGIVCAFLLFSDSGRAQQPPPVGYWVRTSGGTIGILEAVTPSGEYQIRLADGRLVASPRVPELMSGKWYQTSSGKIGWFSEMTPNGDYVLRNAKGRIETGRPPSPIDEKWFISGDKIGRPVGTNKLGEAVIVGPNGQRTTAPAMFEPLEGKIITDADGRPRQVRAAHFNGILELGPAPGAPGAQMLSQGHVAEIKLPQPGQSAGSAPVNPGFSRGSPAGGLLNAIKGVKTGIVAADLALGAKDLGQHAFESTVLKRGSEGKCPLVLGKGNDIVFGEFRKMDFEGRAKAVEACQAEGKKLDFSHILKQAKSNKVLKGVRANCLNDGKIQVVHQNGLTSKIAFEDQNRMQELSVQSQSAKDPANPKRVIRYIPGKHQVAYRSGGKDQVEPFRDFGLKYDCSLQDCSQSQLDDLQVRSEEVGPKTPFGSRAVADEGYDPYEAAKTLQTIRSYLVAQPSARPNFKEVCEALGGKAPDGVVFFNGKSGENQISAQVESGSSAQDGEKSP